MSRQMGRDIGARGHSTITVVLGQSSSPERASYIRVREGKLAIKEMHTCLVKDDPLLTLSVVQRKQVERDTRHDVHVRHLHAKITLSALVLHVESHVDLAYTLHAQISTVANLDVLFACRYCPQVEHVVATAHKSVGCTAVGPKPLSTKLWKRVLCRQSKATTANTLGTLYNTTRNDLACRHKTCHQEVKGARDRCCCFGRR